MAWSGLLQCVCHDVNCQHIILKRNCVETFRVLSTMPTGERLAWLCALEGLSFLCIVMSWELGCDPFLPWALSGPAAVCSL